MAAARGRAPATRRADDAGNSEEAGSGGNRHAGSRQDPASAGMSLADLPDHYVAEMATVAERLGIAEPPRSHAELAAVIDGFGPVVAATELSRQAAYFLRAFPLPPVARLAYGVLFWAAFDSLPAWAQALHDLRCGPLRRNLVRPTARAMLRFMGWALRDAPDPEPDESPEQAPVA